MHQTIEFLLKHGYSVLFAMVLAEQLGAPIPAVPVLLAMGALAGLGNFSFTGSLVLAIFASVLADSAWYALGRGRGQSVLKLLCKISLEPDSCVSNTRQTFKRLGGWALVVAKFFPGLSTVAPPMAGLSKMPWLRFLAADAAGGALWAGVFMGLGYAFRTQIEVIADRAIAAGGRLVTGLIIALALWIAYKYWQRRRFIKSLRVARITPDYLKDHLDEVTILDLRTEAELNLDGFKILGALWFDRKDLENKHTEIPRDRDVVLYCT